MDWRAATGAKCYWFVGGDGEVVSKLSSPDQECKIVLT